jgi:AcrR family transcriptional regulator
MTNISAPSRTTRPSADSTRERIVNAALDLFSERSFEGASTREIAARAGVTQPLLNYHFTNKEELWRAAVDGIFAELTTALAAREEGLRGVDELTTTRLLVREFVLFSAHHPEIHRIVTQENKVDGPRMDWIVERHIRPLYDMVINRFARLVEQALMPALPPPHLYYLMIGAAPTMFVLGPECRRLTGLDATDPRVIETHADAVCELLFRNGTSKPQ